MITIIAGSRTISFSDFAKAMETCPVATQISEVVCGCAQGPDRYGKIWAHLHDLPVIYFPAWTAQYNWASITHKPKELISYPKGGYSHAKANGFYRNKAMSVYGQALVAIWDGASSGTRNMIQLSREAGLATYVFNTGEKRWKLYPDQSTQTTQPTPKMVTSDWNSLPSDARSATR